MAAIRIYESALCCESGVCGPDADTTLVTVTADVRHLKALGADIERHNLATDPTAFTDDVAVRAFLHAVGSTGLPLTAVDGVTALTGTYPSREQLLGFAGLATAPIPAPAATEQGPAENSGGCCGGTAGSC